MEISHVLKSWMFSLKGSETCLWSFEILHAGLEGNVKHFFYQNVFVFFILNFSDTGSGLSKRHGSSDSINLDLKSGQRLYLGPVGIDILLEEESRQLAKGELTARIQAQLAQVDPVLVCHLRQDLIGQKRKAGWPVRRIGSRLSSHRWIPYSSVT